MNSTLWAIVSFGVLQVLALVRSYYGLKQDNKDLAAALILAMTTEQKDRKSAIDGAIFKVDSSISELSHRISVLEAGQDEWTKSLRDRTHELADKMHTMVLKVDRLERDRDRAERSTTAAAAAKD